MATSVRLAGALLAAGALVSVAGCGHAAQHDAAAAPVSARAAASLRTQPGVQAASVRYQDGGVNGAQVFVSLTLDPSVDDDAHVRDLGQIVAKTFWLSDVSPLDGLTITPTDSAAGAGTPVIVVLDTAAAKADLTTRYGPRPTS